MRTRAHPDRELAARAPALPDRALSPAGARGRRPARGLAHPDPAGALRQRRRCAGRAARARGGGLLGGGDPAADRAPGELAPARDAVRHAHGGGSRRARRAPRALLLCPRAERSRVSALYCEVSGRGRDLVLLHGWGLNLRVWDGLAGALTARFRVIAIDLPGHGRSDWDASAGTPAAQAWRVHETLAPLTRRYALLGWSLGGQLALDLAASLPSGIERLALIATTPRFLAGPDWRCGTAPALLARLERQLREDSGRTVREFLKLQVRGVAPRTASRVLALLRGALAAHGAAQPEALARGLDRLKDGDLRGALPLVRMPALVVSGGLDRITPAAAGRALAAALPKGRYVEFARAAHAPFLSSPARFAQVLTEFLRG
ncbi:MAG: alpha/beta fold hydrolase [Gammaproteobacteria bacterium]|nr:MAG: alpha/beta fold hydrolase [Gammaproteobacteria bacterium]